MDFFTKKTFWIVLVIFTCAALLSLLLAFGYDEGAVRSDFVGRVSYGALYLFCLPFVWLFRLIGVEYGWIYIIAILLDVVLLSILVQWTIRKLKQKH
jgi:hypothetical protein